MFLFCVSKWINDANVFVYLPICTADMNNFSFLEILTAKLTKFSFETISGMHGIYGWKLLFTMIN
jgi:hypothetical protein